MGFYWFLLGLLSVWRITHLLSSEDGPWEVVVWIRRKSGLGFWGKLLDCFYCLSLWISAPFAFMIGSSFRERFCLWLAFSAGAILLQRYVPETQPPTPTFFEHGGQDNVMLRQAEESGCSTGDERTSPADTV
jgi:hypothetical protein